jgi:predicted transcriptional regulator of viral defense system
MQLYKLEEGLPKFFSHKDVEKLLNIKKSSAKVLCSRYLKKGFFLHVKRDCYMLKRKRHTLMEEDFLRLSNKLHQPSYVSFTSALWRYRKSARVIGFIECISPQKSSEIKFDSYRFKYYRFPKKLFFGFQESPHGFLVAEPEKALLDIIYMHSLGRYFAHFRGITLEGLSYPKLLRYSKKFPKRTQKILLHLFKRALSRRK